MSSISSDEIISILKNEIENFDQISKDSEVGTVVSVGDGIANIYGIEHAMYGEIVTFENGLKGMVQDIQKDTIGCILFGSDVEIKEGTKVMRTKKKAGVPVGDKFIGRVVNALGAPIDGAGEIEAEDYRPIENEAPGIVDRKSVSVPMETGILSIDSMFPIGRGQRELIIGDRQTGKTSIATDTILNQKGKDVICIYVAIGEKASTIAKVVSTFKNGGICAFDIRYISPLEALKAIKNSGGLAVLAHSGQQQNFSLIPELVKNGLDGLELNHHSHSPKDRETIREYAEKYSLFLTGGSDFHGEFEPADVDLGDFIAEQSGIEKIFD